MTDREWLKEALLEHHAIIITYDQLESFLERVAIMIADNYNVDYARKSAFKLVLGIDYD